MGDFKGKHSKELAQKELEEWTMILSNPQTQEDKDTFYWAPKKQEESPKETIRREPGWRSQALKKKYNKQDSTLELTTKGTKEDNLMPSKYIESLGALIKHI